MFESACEVISKSGYRSPVTFADCWSNDSDRTLVRGRTIAAASAGGEGGGEIKFGTPKYFLYCSIGGAICCGVTHAIIVPLDLVKSRLQVNPGKYKNLVNGFKVTIAEDGWKGLAKGWAPTLIGYSLQGTCKFGFYEYFKVLYSSFLSEEKAHSWRTMIYLCASASAEFIADILLVPWESIKVKIQTTPGYANTLREATPKMYAEEGSRAFYKSLVPLWCRQIPYTMMKFASFERTVELLYKKVVPRPRDQCTIVEQLLVTFSAGYIAGVFCAVVSHPADTLISKLNQEKGKSMGEVAKAMGMKGMWKGLGPRILMVGTLTALQWFIYDFIKVTLKIPRPPPPTVKKSH